MARIVNISLSEKEWAMIEPLITLFYEQGLIKNRSASAFCKWCVIHTLLEISQIGAQRRSESEKEKGEANTGGAAAASG